MVGVPGVNSMRGMSETEEAVRRGKQSCGTCRKAHNECNGYYCPRVLINTIETQNNSLIRKEAAMLELSVRRVIVFLAIAMMPFRLSSLATSTTPDIWTCSGGYISPTAGRWRSS
ncbi:hypothetical protein BDW67DRAFT_141720 [Aspergillus spinulosporus]